MIKIVWIVSVMIVSTVVVTATPPKPQTFVENRGIEPSIKLATYMKAHISKAVRDVIYVWNHSYSDPNKQIADLIIVFRYLVDTPSLPRQILLNKEFEIYRVLDTKKIIKAIDRFEEDANQASRALFEYSSVIIGTKEGSMQKRYNKMLSSMKTMVKSYNNLAKVTNQEYKQNYMPYYKLNQKQ